MPKDRKITATVINTNGARDKDCPPAQADAHAESDSTKLRSAVNGLKNALKGGFNIGQAASLEGEHSADIMFATSVPDLIKADYKGEEEAKIRINFSDTDKVEIEVTPANIEKVRNAYKAATEAVHGMAAKLKEGVATRDSEVFHGVTNAMKASLKASGLVK